MINTATKDEGRRPLSHRKRRAAATDRSSFVIFSISVVKLYLKNEHRQ
jgi:hypothetical protein